MVRASGGGRRRDGPRGEAMQRPTQGGGRYFAMAQSSRATSWRKAGITKLADAPGMRMVEFDLAEDANSEPLDRDGVESSAGDYFSSWICNMECSSQSQRAGALPHSSNQHFCRSLGRSASVKAVPNHRQNESKCYNGHKQRVRIYTNCEAIDGLIEQMDKRTEKG